MISLLGLHGSSGRPSQMEPLLQQLGWDLPSHLPTGTIPDGDGFTFFARRPDRSIPQEALIDLARESLRSDGYVACFASETPLIVGFSSGAIFGAALLAVQPEKFAGAILLRPQPISDGFRYPPLDEKPVLILSGLRDIRRDLQHARIVAEQMRAAGAKVTLHELDVEHAWTAEDIDIARRWFAETFASQGQI